MRYVRCYRCEAIQCRGDNIRPTSIRIADYYVNPGLLRRISLTTYRKCGGGFAKTGRAMPCPPTGAGASLIRGDASQGTLRRGDGAMWASPPTLDRKKGFRTSLI
ncbi:MAG: hypothetical protein LBM98_02720 [Oscillospiraceae bacterium]|nr:hypothetical protein [Oscillospiraceae bacterium]